MNMSAVTCCVDVDQNSTFVVHFVSYSILLDTKLCLKHEPYWLDLWSACAQTLVMSILHLRTLRVN